MNGSATVLLHWLPLGAGGRSVRWNGRALEAVASRWRQRTPADLVHAALEVHLGPERFVVEMAPAWGGPPTDRGVVVEGPVGSRVLGRSPYLRYEVRRWRAGVIPDLAEAVGPPRRLDAGADRALRLLALVPLVPALTWGRDELRTGDAWSSNSVVSWLLASSRHDVEAAEPPPGARAPGWAAGLALAG